MWSCMYAFLILTMLAHTFVCNTRWYRLEPRLEDFEGNTSGNGTLRVFAKVSACFIFKDRARARVCVVLELKGCGLLSLTVLSLRFCHACLGPPRCVCFLACFFCSQLTHQLIMPESAYQPLFSYLVVSKPVFSPFLLQPRMCHSLSSHCAAFHIC